MKKNILVFIIAFVIFLPVNTNAKISLNQSQNNVYSLTSISLISKNDYTIKKLSGKDSTESFEGFCTEKRVKNSMKFIGSLLLIVKIIVPILLIIFGAIDFGKATISYDADAIQKATKTLMFRVIAGIVIFLIPTIVNFVFDDLINVKTGYDECRVCIFSPGRC